MGTGFLIHTCHDLLCKVREVQLSSSHIPAGLGAFQDKDCITACIHRTASTTNPAGMDIHQRAAISTPEFSLPEDERRG